MMAILICSKVQWNKWLVRQVLLCSTGPASSSLQHCEAQIQDVCKAYWLVKITAAVPEAQAVQAAHAIGKQWCSNEACPTSMMQRQARFARFGQNVVFIFLHCYRLLQQVSGANGYTEKRVSHQATG